MDSRRPKGEHRKRKYLRTKKHELFILIAVFFCIMISPMASAESVDSSVMRFYSGNPGTITIEQLTIKDDQGNPVAIGQEKSFALSVSDILARLNAGEVGASQSALFATVADGQQGIIKNIVDVAADPINSDMDLVIVLDVSGSMSQRLPGTGLPSGQNTRLAVAKQAIIQLSECVLSEDRNNRIAVVAFSTGVDGTIGFTGNRETVKGFITQLSTGNYTNYESGFNQAEVFLNERTEAEKERKACVLLITDGQPNYGNALAGANQLKSNTNAELYCIGIQSGASNLLRTLATDDHHVSDCATADEFMDYMSQVKQKLPTAQSAMIRTEIGSGSTLLCSEAYPITIGEDIYSSIDEIPSDLMLFTDEQGKIQWNIAAVDCGGLRFSYYTRLINEAGTDLNDHPMMPVSNAGYLEYRPYYKGHNGMIQIAAKPTVTALPAYLVAAESSVLTATIFSDKMETGHTLVGRSLKYGDKIQYTV